MNKYMKIAVEEAINGIHQNHGGPFGCVIVKDGIIIGKGHNEVIRQNDPTCHGEMMAIHDACKTLESFDLNGCELYTTAAPCPMCLGAILWANIKKYIMGVGYQILVILDLEMMNFILIQAMNQWRLIVMNV